MSNKAEQLKELQAQKKAMREQEKALREELDAGKEERKEARKAKADARKEVLASKKAIRELTAKTYEVFTNDNALEISELADDIMEASTELVTSIRKFAEASETLENL